MIELPEARVLADQISNELVGKRVTGVVTAASPHKFAWYYGDPLAYDSRLSGKQIDRAVPIAGRVEVYAEGVTLDFFDGANLRLYKAGEAVPTKHQLAITFDDGSTLVGTIAMYGALMCYPDGALDDDSYRNAAVNAISPLSERFDAVYAALFDTKGLKMSAKAFLATVKRVPGLGNGVLQDILLNACIHPKTKAGALSMEQRSALLCSIKDTLAEMVRLGGRDTERDLYGNPGGYKVKLGRTNTAMVCPNCGGSVHKESYMGGSIYFCESCQRI
ncbi:formamidopyrimidine-DNA glycosylase [Clostridia bacterium]|nr:formamidopyrimidine-DNA glycosylase [Clostridia bacterium]